MSFVFSVAPFFRWPFTVLFFFTSRSFLAPYRVRLLESVSLIHRGSAFSSHLGCAMRKLPKVVPITLKRKPGTAIEVPIPVEGAIRLLTCHRTPAQIHFPLDRHLRPAKLWYEQSRASDSESDVGSSTSTIFKAELRTLRQH